jgi:hypothetical protein
MLRALSPQGIQELNDRPDVPMSYQQNIVQPPFVSHDTPPVYLPLTYNESRQELDVAYTQALNSFTEQCEHEKTLYSIYVQDMRPQQPANPPCQLTKNGQTLCKLVSNQPIIFNPILHLVNAVVPKKRGGLDFQPTMKHLTEEQQRLLANQLPQGIMHLEKLNARLIKLKDPSHPVTNHLMLVPILLEQMKKARNANPYKEQCCSCVIL